MPHLFISATRKSSGKTVLTTGIAAALVQRGLTVQTCKKGPDYIDPMWLGVATGRPCCNLDFHTMARDEIVAVFERCQRGVDIALIEGNKGLYDGLDLHGSNSNAALAGLLDAPVILVIDARGMTRGVAPLIRGYQAFDPAIRIAGVILNQLGGSRHESKLRAVIEHYTDTEVLGCVQADPALALEERHLGLIPGNEARDTEAWVARMAAAVEQQVDVERMIDIAATAGGVTRGTPAETSQTPSSLTIGFARDSAFGFYYPSDLAALEANGARLVPFDTLNDTRLPSVDGLFIGGGFPETHMEKLERNASLRAAIAQAIAEDMPVYAECGGLMYLTRSLSWQGRRAAMVGALPADTVMHDRPMGRGYVRLRETGCGPWPRPAGTHDGGEINAHEFHHSTLTGLAAETVFAYEMCRGTGIDGSNDGIVYRNVLASYAHLQDTRAHHWTARFVEFVRSCMGRGRTAHRVSQVGGITGV